MVGEIHGMFQVRRDDRAEANAPLRPKLAVGADFGEVVTSTRGHLAGGWQEEVPQGAQGYVSASSSGIKLMFGESFRPYVLMGGGVMHLRLPELLELERPETSFSRSGRRPGQSR
jgi:hypothetical protein